MGGGGGSSPSISQPVVTSTAQAAESARQAQLSELKRQGMASTLLSQNASSSSGGSTGTKSLLGGN